MKVTVTQFDTHIEHFEEQWQALVAHCQAEHSELVVLPEMGFAPWIFNTQAVNPDKWAMSIERHDQYIARLGELGAGIVLASRPITVGDKRHNAGYVWTPETGAQIVHHKYYLPDEPGFWEATWYQRGEEKFEAAQAGDVKVGFTLCTDMWFMDKARSYGEQGVHIQATPRSTERATLYKWRFGGQAAAVIGGTFHLSSNHYGDFGEAVLGGEGWIVTPDGSMLCMTTVDEPFVSAEIDLAEAERAKSTYPRYVRR